MQIINRKILLVKRMIYAQKRNKEMYCSAMVRYFWCIVSMFMCLPPMTTMCMSLRAQCISVWIWQILTACVREAFYCAGISRTVRCVNAKAKKKGVGEQETNKQTNKDGSTGWQAEQLTAANNWWQILILSFMLFAPLRGRSLFLFFFTSCFFIVLSWSLR